MEEVGSVKKLNPQKVFVQYREKMNPYEPVINRKYTITHSDTTAELFVFVGETYAEDQITKMRDEVKISWMQNEDEKGLTLAGTVAVSGKGIQGSAFIRNQIFYNEMPTALQALRQADRFLFDQDPNLDQTPVFIYFMSDDAKYDKLYDFGVIGDYK